MSARTFFFPGDRVRIILGDGIGFPGQVISNLEAVHLWQVEGYSAASLGFRPGRICVAISILGKRMPIALDAAQPAPDPNA